LLNAPRKDPAPEIKVISSRVPSPEEVVLVPPQILKTATKLLGLVNGNVKAKWAISGDAAEVMMGVNVNADYIEILTTKEGCDEIDKILVDYRTLAPAMVEKKIPRDADIDGKMLPVFIRSHYAEFGIDGVKVEVHGDEQIKVGEWEWGDALDYTGDYTYIPGGKLPLVPLSLKSELYLGLGWLDRVTLVSDAVLQKHHGH
jgi:hypothetical protein